MHSEIFMPGTSRFTLKRAFCIVLFSCLATIAAHAQSANGSITGNITNIATNVSVKGAEVAIKGTQLLVYTDQSGDYIFTGVPAGEATVVVTYTGLAAQEKRVTIPAGDRVTANFDMVPVDAPKIEQVVELEKFVVSAEREGNARAFTEQRNAIGITQVVATDAYGSVTSGNVAEFLKFLPGITMNNDESEIRSVGLSGMDAQYTGVTIDGAKLATSSGGSLDDARTFQFQLLSSDAIESIEVDLLGGGDSPGGTIKLRTKGAFDQKGRLLNYDVFVIANSNYPNFSRTPGGGDEFTRKTKPGFRFNYSEAFFRNTVGFSLGLSRMGYYNLNDFMSYSYGELTPTLDGTNDDQSASTEILPYITGIHIKDANRVEQKDSLFMKVDYKLSPFGKVALSMNYANVEQEFFNRSMSFTLPSGASTTVFAPHSSLTHVEGGTALHANNTNQASNKISETISGNLKFDYKFSHFEVDALFGYSKSTTKYNVANKDAPYFYTVSSGMSPGTAWVADRPNPQSTNWTFTRTGTNDWSDPRNWTIGNILARNTHAENNVSQFVSNLKWRAPTGFPLTFTLTMEGTLEKKHIMPDRYAESYVYTPPVAESGITDFVSPYKADTRLGGNLGDLNIPYLDKSALYHEFVNNPSSFALHPDAINNVLKRQLQGYNDTKETLAAATFEITARPWPRLDIQARLRYDYTDQEALVTLLRTSQELTGPGFNFQAGADENTVEYIRAQFYNGERKLTTNTYSELMPSISVRYKITNDLMARVGFSTSIGRVNVGYISGAWGFGTYEGEPMAAAPNPRLQPDIFRKVLFALSYYLKPQGELSATISEQFWTGSATEASYAYPNQGPEESWDQGLLGDLRSIFGTEYIDGLIGDGYVIRTFSDYNKTDRKVRQIALSYNQPLPFYKPVNVFATFTRTIPDWVRSGQAPRNASGGISYSGRYIFARIKGVWWDRFRVANIGANNETWRKSRMILDFDAQIKISKRLNFYIVIDNLTNAASTTFYGISPDFITRTDRYGAKITLGIKGNF